MNSPHHRLGQAMVGNWINGRPSGAAGRTSPVFNPATGEAAREVLLSTPGDAGDAVQAAAAAFADWSATPSVKRARVLFAFKAWMEKKHGCACHGDHAGAWQDI